MKKAPAKLLQVPVKTEMHVPNYAMPVFVLVY